jgi:ferrous iron transport protein B
MGGVILVGSVVVWFLGAFPNSLEPMGNQARQVGTESVNQLPVIKDAETAQTKVLPEPYNRRDAFAKSEEQARLEHSFLGRLGHAIAPIFAPLGFDWRTSVAVVTGFVAKEIVVSTLGVLYAAGADVDEESEALRRSLRASGMTPLGAYTLMAFVLIYIPCLATVAVIRRETNSWRWTAFSIGYSLVLAWIVSFLIYQVGRILGLA